MNNLLAQFVGLSAVIFFVSSVQQKKKSTLLIFQLIANLLYGIQYLLLNALTAGIVNFIAILRCIVFFKYDKKKVKTPRLWLIFIIILILLVALKTVTTPIQVIPVIISILYTVSTFQSDMKKIRITFIFCGVFWLYYNYTFGAYTSLLGNIFEIISGYTALLRHNKKNKDYFSSKK